MSREELIESLKVEISKLESLVSQSSSNVGSRGPTLDILSDISRKLSSKGVDMNDFDAIASSLIRNFDSLREFVVGDMCKYSALESSVERISKLRSLAKDHPA